MQRSKPTGSLVSKFLTFALVAIPAFVQAQTFSFTGATQEYVVPCGVTTLQVKVWGAGGGGFIGGSGLGASYRRMAVPADIPMLKFR